MAKKRRIVEEIRMEFTSAPGIRRRAVISNIHRIVRLECGHTACVGEKARVAMCEKCDSRGEE